MGYVEQEGPAQKGAGPSALKHPQGPGQQDGLRTASARQTEVGPGNQNQSSGLSPALLSSLPTSSAPCGLRHPHLPPGDLLLTFQLCHVLLEHLPDPQGDLLALYSN